MTIAEFFAHWHELNEYLALFPPHGGDDQKLGEDEIIENIYDKLPKRMKSDLQRMNDFDINNTDLTSLCNALEHLDLACKLDPTKPEPKKKDSNSNNDKRSGKKRANQGNDSSSRPKKKQEAVHAS